MARRRRTYTRRATRTIKRTYNRTGGFKPIIDGAIAGIAAEAGQKFLGNWGAPLGIGAVGMFMKNNTLKTIAGLQVGSIVGDMLPFISGGGSAVGGVY